ncbi:hypothetical protein [Mucilaginibacter glaciei]|uniref:Outer membrane protein with beta-barrel domain n=1 Tax=Mucilaginibacter glaciei TaxID=2772109 RepID=A0A926S0R6_9SPHI|nr:hypothetical protein [Mucilaginibacter glaciei]MBD1393250.1 hypothetical protein [Mucilaginibacter glaciei]
MATLLSKAQIGYDYAQYDLGFGGNINRVYGDAETIRSTPSAHISFTYNYTPYVNYVVEAQGGILEGGDVNSMSGRYFRNVYKAIVFRGQLQAGELIRYSDSKFFNGLKNLYVSAGFGYIMNSMHAINRQSYVITDYVTPGEDKSNELFLPIRLGYEFKFFNQYDEPSFKVDIGGTYNHDFGDGLDGFKAGTSKDNFIQYGITLKFAIGGVTSYRKKVSY